MRWKLLMPLLGQTMDIIIYDWYPYKERRCIIFRHCIFQLVKVFTMIKGVAFVNSHLAVDSNWNKNFRINSITNHTESKGVSVINVTRINFSQKPFISSRNTTISNNITSFPTVYSNPIPQQWNSTSDKGKHTILLNSVWKRKCLVILLFYNSLLNWVCTLSSSQVKLQNRHTTCISNIPHLHRAADWTRSTLTNLYQPV